MTNSLSRSGAPLVSNRLANYLADETSESTAWGEDALDRLSLGGQLTISRLAFFRDLDLFLVILSNRWVISQRLSTYPALANATDEQLAAYETSASGIHWPALDIDLSLCGSLLDELVGKLRADYPAD